MVLSIVQGNSGQVVSIAGWNPYPYRCVARATQRQSRDIGEEKARQKREDGKKCKCGKENQWRKRLKGVGHVSLSMSSDVQERTGKKQEEEKYDGENVRKKLVSLVNLPSDER